MRAFKKLMAATIATAMAATMATSAFAAELTDAGKVSFVKTTDAEGNVTAYDYNAVGQTTVLIVPADVWVQADDQTWSITGLTDAKILYIDQYEDAATANTAIAAGFGVKLNEDDTLDVGNYYALFGGYTGTDSAFAITAVPFEVKLAEDNTREIQLGECDGATGITGGDALTVAKHVAGLVTLTGDTLIAADCDGATGITGGDALAIAKHVAGMLVLGKVTVTE